MDVKGVLGAGGHGLDSVIDNVARIRATLPGEARALVESARAADVAGALGAAGERADAARLRAAEHAEEALARAADAVDAVRERAAGALESAGEHAQDLALAADDTPAGRSRVPAVVAAVAVTGAAAAAGVLVWRRRQRAEAEEVEIAQTWRAPEPPVVREVVTDIVVEEAVVSSAGAGHEDYAERLDHVADDLAGAFVTAVDDLEGLSAVETVDAIEAIEAEDAVVEIDVVVEEFYPGTADEQSPDVVDEEFAAGVDAAAAAIADSFVDAVETEESRN